MGVPDRSTPSRGPAIGGIGEVGDTHEFWWISPWGTPAHPAGRENRRIEGRIGAGPGSGPDRDSHETWWVSPIGCKLGPNRE